MPTPTLTLEQQVALCQKIAQLTQAKLPLTQQLAIMGDPNNSKIAQAGQQVQQSLMEGKSLSDALIHGDSSVDSRILAACLEVGQSSNCLDQSLEHWTAMHLARWRSRMALRSAMFYPVALIFITLVAIGWTAWNLIPDIAATYQQFEAELPVWLNVLIVLRQHFIWTMALMIVMLMAPLVLWYLFRQRVDQFGVPKAAGKRLRLQALASFLASLQLDARRPLSEVLPLCVASMGTDAQHSHKAFQDLRLHRTLAGLPMETTMVLASLHCGILTVDKAAEHCRQISQRLGDQAEILDQRTTQWLPVLVALAAGTITLLAYGILVYLPWIALMTRIGTS